MKIPAVIVLYNPSINNLKSIDNYKTFIDKLYIVDNTEDDIIRFQSDDKIKYIKFADNKGIACALNLGAKEAIKDGYKFLLTLDQDSKFTSEHLREMVDFLKKYKRDDLGLISPYHELKFQQDITNGNVEEMIEVMTSGNIINLDAYCKVGGYDDSLFIDCVDTDYCMKLNLNHFKVLRLNYIKMKHSLGNMKIHHILNKSVVSYNHDATRMYYIARNNLYINEKYKSVFPEHCSWLLRCIKGQKRRVILFEKNKLKKLFMIKKGYRDFKKGIKGKLK